jgi:excisionase family DNA binding protein
MNMNVHDGETVELLTVPEAAALLRVSPITIRRYIADGQLPAVRVGKGVRIEREALDQFLSPIAPRTNGKTAAKSGGAFTMEDSLWRLAGIADSGPDGPTDVSENKYRYLADAYAPPAE